MNKRADHLVLQALRSASSPRTLHEVANAIGYGTTTVAAVLRSLVDRGLVVRGPTYRQHSKTPIVAFKVAEHARSHTPYGYVILDTITSKAYSDVIFDTEESAREVSNELGDARLMVQEIRDDRDLDHVLFSSEAP